MIRNRVASTRPYGTATFFTSWSRNTSTVARSASSVSTAACDDDTLVGVMNGKGGLVFDAGEHYWFGLERDIAL